MPREHYDKLVRDKIPERLAGKGLVFSAQVLDEQIFKRKLRQKLEEETKEAILAQSREELTSELADLQEAILALQKAEGILASEVEEVRLKKLQERGGFDTRTNLDWVDE